MVSFIPDRRYSPTVNTLNHAYLIKTRVSVKMHILSTVAKGNARTFGWYIQSLKSTRCQPMSVSMLTQGEHFK